MTTLPDLLITRPPRGRGLRLAAREDGVELIWPARVSREQMLAFVTRHRGWIDRQHAVHAHARARLGHVLKLDPATEGLIPLFGVPTPIVWHEGAAAMRHDDGELHVHLPLQHSSFPTALRRLLLTGLEAQLRQAALADIATFEPVLGAQSKGLRIKPMASLWGSLSPQGAVSLNLSLVLLPREATRYIVAHELAHLLHHNHSTRFWAAVARIYPDYLATRRLLKRDHMLLKQLMRRLFG